MSQETEDPRQVPPKQYGSTQPGQSAGSESKPGGMQDDLDESRGATDRDNAGNDSSRERSAGSRSSTGSQSGKGASQQQGARESSNQDKGAGNHTGSGSSSGSGSSRSSDSKR